MFGKARKTEALEKLATWRVFGKSVRGVSHLRAGLPNQDAIGWLPENGLGPPILSVVSDGHGSDKSFRSDRGAKLAVEAAEIVWGAFKTPDEPVSPSSIKRQLDEVLPRELTRQWTQTVADDLLERPFDRGELERLESSTDPEKTRQVILDPLLAYGATILCVLITESFIAYIQLGDGDIVTVSQSGEATRPVPKDERLFADETTSLSSREAWRDVVTVFQVMPSPPPAMVLISTDGYANSFRDVPDFLQVGPDLLEMIRSDGISAVETNLEAWLAEASRVGSGDDVTLAAICRIGADS